MFSNTSHILTLSVSYVKLFFVIYFIQIFYKNFSKKNVVHRYRNAYLYLNQRDIFQHVPITSRKPVKPDSKGFPGFFAFWGSSRILANPGAS